MPPLFLLVNPQRHNAEKKKAIDMNIFGDNSRWEHCKAGFWIAACLTILCTLGAMSGAEFKDEKHGGKWDWSDWGWGMVGGVAGQIVQLIIVYVLWILA